MLLTLLLACLSVLSAAILASIFCDDSLGFSFNKKQTHVFKISPSPNIKAILNFVCNVEDLNTKTNFTYRRQALLREFLVQYLSNFLSARLYFIEFVIKSSWKSKKKIQKMTVDMSEVDQLRLQQKHCLLKFLIIFLLALKL